MLYKLCARCHKPTKQGNPYCDACRPTAQSEQASNRAKRMAAYDANQRDQRKVAFYRSKPWRLLSQRKMMDVGYQCEVCKANGRIAIAEDVHHIVPLSKDWSRRLDYDNLLAVCSSCHRKIEGKPCTLIL